MAERDKSTNERDKPSYERDKPILQHDKLTHEHDKTQKKRLFAKGRKLLFEVDPQKCNLGPTKFPLSI